MQESITDYWAIALFALMVLLAGPLLFALHVIVHRRRCQYQRCGPKPGNVDIEMHQDEELNDYDDNDDDDESMFD